MSSSAVSRGYTDPQRAEVMTSAIWPVRAEAFWAGSYLLIPGSMRFISAKESAKKDVKWTRNGLKMKDMCTYVIYGFCPAELETLGRRPKQKRMRRRQGKGRKVSERNVGK